MMKIEDRARRLREELPGWHVWHGSLAGWFAVPAPTGIALAAAVELPNRIGPFRDPQQLREECRARYGWDDHCDSCGELARRCGHRRPELPPIPRRIWTRDLIPQFCRWGEGWAVVGPDDTLLEHSEVAVSPRDGSVRMVAIGRHIAARVVRHRPDSYTRQAQGQGSTRYVVAEIQQSERVDEPS